MGKVILSFEAENSDELSRLVAGFALAGKKAPSWVGAPLDAEAAQAEAEAREAIQQADDEEDAKQLDFPDGNGADHAPSAPEPAPTKKPRAARTPRVSAPAPAPAPTPTPNERELPPLDALKAAVTQAVRLAQKGEGSKKILDLLPGFKEATGLEYVMNAEDKHRGALYDLVEAAGLPVV